jgi:hypothetical protein
MTVAHVWFGMRQPMDFAVYCGRKHVRIQPLHKSIWKLQWIRQKHYRMFPAIWNIMFHVTCFLPFKTLCFTLPWYSNQVQGHGGQAVHTRFFIFRFSCLWCKKRLKFCLRYIGTYSSISVGSDVSLIRILPESDKYWQGAEQQSDHLWAGSIRSWWISLGPYKARHKAKQCPADLARTGAHLTSMTQAIHEAIHRTERNWGRRHIVWPLLTSLSCGLDFGFLRVTFNIKVLSFQCWFNGKRLLPGFSFEWNWYFRGLKKNQCTT